MKKVLFILRNHFTNDSRVQKEAQTLASKGYKVVIRCLWDKDLLKKDNSKGYSVERVCYSDRTKVKTTFKKIIVFIKYTFVCMKKINSFEIVHCHDLDGLVVGFIAKLLSFGKLKLIYDAHEYEVEISRYQDYQRKILYKLENFLIKFTDEVITVSPSIADEYAKNYNIDRPKLILNCPPLNLDKEKSNIFRDKFNLSKDKIIFLYQGGLFKNRGIEIALEAFSSLEESNKVIVFMGYGPLEKLIKKTSLEVNNVFFHEAVSPDVLLKYTSSADMGIVLIENMCLSYFYCLPNKLFECTQANLPVIVSDLYEMSKIINKYKNGIIASENADSLADAIKQITFEKIVLFSNNIPEMKKIYNWEEQEKVLVSIYENI